MIFQETFGHLELYKECGANQHICFILLKKKYPWSFSCNQWRNLVGDKGDLCLPLFQTGEHNMPCPPTFFSLGFVFGEVS